MKQHCKNCSCGKPWRLKKGVKYLFFSSDGKIVRDVFVNDFIDDDRLAFGNVFKSEADAIEARDAVKKLLLRLKK